MRIQKIGLCAVLLAFAAFLGLSRIPVRQAATSEPAVQPTAEPAETDEPVETGEAIEAAAFSDPSAQSEPLLPDFDQKSIVNVSVTTAERQFNFNCTDRSTVSVNGHQADAEIFAKLIDQIVSLPVVALSPFTPQENPVLTLTINTEAGQITASFFNDGDNGTNARIICVLEGTSIYRMTDGWRIGTLLLTCDGTRIQDASGHELPAQQTEE